MTLDMGPLFKFFSSCFWLFANVFTHFQSFKKEAFWLTRSLLMQAEEPPPAQFFNAAVSTSSGDFTLLTMTALPRMAWFKHDLCWHNPMPLAGVALWAAQSVSRCP